MEKKKGSQTVNSDTMKIYEFSLKGDLMYSQSYIKEQKLHKRKVII